MSQATRNLFSIVRTFLFPPPVRAPEHPHPKALLVVEQLKKRGIHPVFSGDLYRDDAVYVDLPPDVACFLPSEGPGGWRLVYASVISCNAFLDNSHDPLTILSVDKEAILRAATGSSLARNASPERLAWEISYQRRLIWKLLSNPPCRLICRMQTPVSEQDAYELAEWVERHMVARSERRP